MTLPPSLGPFFALEERMGEGWQPLDEFCEDPAAVRARVDAVAGRLGLQPSEADRRIASSVAALGMTTRIVSPLFALALAERPVGRLWWRPSDTSMYAVAIDDGPQAAGDGLLEIAERISLAHKEFCPSPTVRAGNIVSAISGAAALVARQTPALADRCAKLADGLARRCGDATYTGGAGTPEFRRGTCCLLYRATESLCPDCVLGSHALVQ